MVIILVVVTGLIFYTILQLNGFMGDRHSLNFTMSIKNSSKLASRFWEDFPLSFDPECLSSSTFNRQEYRDSNLDFLKTDEGKKFKSVLGWHHAYYNHFGFGFGHLPFEKACCKEKRCFMTARRNGILISEFDAILFHHRNLQPQNLPKVRSEHQRWIFYEREPPPLSYGPLEIYNNVFNWTMTYRMDSDVLARSYGYIYPTKLLNRTIGEGNFSINTSALRKKRLVAWVVSNCKTTSRREDFVRRLQKYIKVDVYGKCGPLKCTKGNECFAMIEKRYKFYLSFENSLCVDYTTEKLLRTLKYNIVPVVFGGGDYDYIAPPHSYIDARKFENEKHLADYLLFLDKNETAYFEYFKWKPDFVVMNIASQINFCNLCEKLHENNTEKKSYQNIREWFVGKAKCKGYP